MVEFKQISLQSSHSSINLKHFVFIMFMLNHDVHLSCITFIYDLSYYLVSTTCTPIVKHLCITIYIVSTNCTPYTKTFDSMYHNKYCTPIVKHILVLY